MRIKKLYPVLCAILVMLAVTLACNALAPATPGASNFYMANDKQGTNKTNVFAPSDDFYVFFDVKGIEPGTKFQARWYVLDLEGQDPNTPIQTIDYAYESGIANIYFQLTSAEDWPVANYKVEVYMNDAKIGEQAFSVQ